MKNKIDWLNHGVAFLAALLGILIAFQLEAFQNNRQENEKLRITLNSIKEEIKNNQYIYKSNIETLSNWFEYYSYADEFYQNGKVEISSTAFERMKSKSPNRFQSWKIGKESNDSIYIFNHAEFLIDIVPEIGISSSSWQAGLYSGVLNKLDIEQLTNLNKIYMWTEKDLGLNESGFYEMVAVEEITNLNLLEDYYKKVIKIQQLKMDRIDFIYNQIEW